MTRMVRVPDLIPGDPEFKSRSYHQSVAFVLGSLNTSAAPVHCQLVFLVPVGIPNLLSLFQ